METIAKLIPDIVQRAMEPTTAASPTSNWRPTLDEHDRSLTVAADACARFIADMERDVEPYWLTITGKFGCGKTMLARQTFERARDHCNPGRHSLWVAGTGIRSEDRRRPNCEWFTAKEFITRIGSGEWDLPDYLRPDYLVVIDDLGAARDKAEILADGIYSLADQRCHRWMIWTTNLSLNEIRDRIDGRVASRIIRDDNRLVTITAPDYALVKK